VLQILRFQSVMCFCGTRKFTFPLPKTQFDLSGLHITPFFSLFSFYLLQRQFFIYAVQREQFLVCLLIMSERRYEVPLPSPHPWQLHGRFPQFVELIKGLQKLFFQPTVFVAPTRLKPTRVNFRLVRQTFSLYRPPGISIWSVRYWNVETWRR
jgi:hypothetical protein